MKKAYEGDREEIKPNYLYTIKELVPVMAMSENRVREILQNAYGSNKKIRGNYRVLGSDIVNLFKIAN